MPRRDIRGGLVSDVPKQEPLSDDQIYNGGRIRTDAIALVAVVGDFAKRFPRPRKRHMLINPETISETISPQVSRRPVIGLSHEVIQYIRTNSRELSFDLQISQLVAARVFDNPVTDVSGYRHWFMGLALPLGPRLATPMISITWARGIKSFTGVLTNLSWEYERWSAEGNLMEFSMSLTLVETQYGLKTAAKAVSGRSY